MISCCKILEQEERMAEGKIYDILAGKDTFLSILEKGCGTVSILEGTLEQAKDMPTQ